MKKTWTSCCLCLFILPAANAQDTAQQKLNLEEVIKRALADYPGIRAARAQASAASAGVELARTSYLPKLDLIYQENRASRNNVFGTLLPQSTIPSMSGPVLGTTTMDSAWGSAGGMLFSWEPFDFGTRKAGVEAAKAQRDRADSGMDLTRLDVAVSAADTFLSLAAAEQTVAAADANLKRARAFAVSVHALVDNQLRPGADASRADADVATAQNQLILAQRDAEILRATLAESIGIAGVSITIDYSSLAAPPREEHLPPFNPDSHPQAQAQKAAVAAARARERAVERSYFPRFSYQFALFGRGSGALVDGRIDAGGGLWPDVPNWATGLTVTFPAFDMFGIRARQKIETGNELAEQARYDQIVQSLKAQEARARTALHAALEFASNTPIQLKAAQETHVRANARYQAGLATIVEVADAQRLLAQAEIDDAIAKMSVWRSLLAVVRVGGDLQPFVSLLSGIQTRQKP